ncbi:MAG: hypothetical protein KJ571_13600 [Bacteroidetes bacterium]|nr:hypothetical protein [Bacteroidota bacterium]
MKEKYKYIYDERTGIFYKYYYGAITIKDIHTSWDEAIKNNLIPKNKKGFILDYTKATFDMKLSDHIKIADYYKDHLEIFGNHKIAILTQSAKDVAIPVLVESKDNGYYSHPFYTLEAAVRWVLS